MTETNYQLSTDRLDLIPFASKEADLFHQINTDPFVRKYLWDDELIDKQVAEEVIRTNSEHFKNDHYGLWKIQLKSSKEVIGYLGLWYFFDEPQPQLIYALFEKFTKQGYATEAGLCLMQYVFDQLGFDYLVAATDEPHLASQQVAERLGMSKTETRVENDKPTVFFRIDKP